MRSGLSVMETGIMRVECANACDWLSNTRV
jgi:hypothetical protein